MPKYVKSALNCEHVLTEVHFKRMIAPLITPDLVIALKKYISHKQSEDAFDYAKSVKVPFILATSFSHAIQHSMEIEGLEWFADDLQKASLPEEDAQETSNVLESCWRESYEKQWQANKALEKRLKKDHIKLEGALEKLSRAEARENAATRVISEVREAAKLKKVQDFKILKRQDEIVLILNKLLEHQELLKTQTDVVEDIRTSVKNLLDETFWLGKTPQID